MKLSTWIAANGGRKAVAERLGVTHQVMGFWFTSRATPKWSTIYKIVEITRGKVTPREILEETNEYARKLSQRGVW